VERLTVKDGQQPFGQAHAVEIAEELVVRSLRAVLILHLKFERVAVALPADQQVDY